MAIRSRLEQETIINFNAAEKNAVLYTSDPVMIRRMDKICEKSPCVQDRKIGDYGREYTFPKNMVKVRLPRQLSDEKRKELVERFRREK